MRKYQEVKHNWSSRERINREEGNRVEKLLENIITKTSLNLAKDQKMYIQDVQQTSSSINTKKTTFTYHTQSGGKQR